MTSRNSKVMVTEPHDGRIFTEGLRVAPPKIVLKLGRHAQWKADSNAVVAGVDGTLACTGVTPTVVTEHAGGYNEVPSCSNVTLSCKSVGRRTTTPFGLRNRHRSRTSTPYRPLRRRITMTRFAPRRWPSVVAVGGAIVLGLSACGEADVMRAYNQDGSATDEFVGVVADFMTAVHDSDADHLNQIKDSAGSADGVKELLAAYGGATLSVASYYFDHPGEGSVDIDVRCTNGTRATFDQGFFGRDGKWRPVVLGTQPLNLNTDAPLPDEALSAPVPMVSAPPSTNKPAVTAWNQYPPCSNKPVTTSTG